MKTTELRMDMNPGSGNSPCSLVCSEEDALQVEDAVKAAVRTVMSVVYNINCNRMQKFQSTVSELSRQNELLQARLEAAHLQIHLLRCSQDRARNTAKVSGDTEGETAQTGETTLSTEAELGGQAAAAREATQNKKKTVMLLCVRQKENVCAGKRTEFSSVEELNQEAHGSQCIYCTNSSVCSEKHLYNRHHRFSMYYTYANEEKFTIPCLCKDLPNTSRSHWHCPRCRKTITKRFNFVAHLKSHGCFIKDTGEKSGSSSNESICNTQNDEPNRTRSIQHKRPHLSPKEVKLEPEDSLGVSFETGAAQGQRSGNKPASPSCRSPVTSKEPTENSIDWFVPVDWDSPGPNSSVSVSEGLVKREKKDTASPGVGLSEMCSTPVVVKSELADASEELLHMDTCREDESSGGDSNLLDVEEIQADTKGEWIHSKRQPCRPEHHRRSCGRGRVFTTEQEASIVRMVVSKNGVKLRDIQRTIIQDQSVFSNINRVSLATIARVLSRNNVGIRAREAETVAKRTGQAVPSLPWTADDAQIALPNPCAQEQAFLLDTANPT